MFRQTSITVNSKPRVIADFSQRSHIRSDANRTIQTHRMKSMSKERHHNFLREALVKQFMARYNLVPKAEELKRQNYTTRFFSHRDEAALASLVASEFDEFLCAKNFSQKALTAFERELNERLPKLASDSGVRFGKEMGSGSDIEKRLTIQQSSPPLSKLVSPKSKPVTQQDAWLVK